MNLPVEVVQAINEGRCVLIAGSRFSAESAEEQGRKYPEDKALATSLGWKRKKQMMGTVKSRKVASAPSVAGGAQIFESANGRSSLVANLKMQIGVQDAEPTPAHRTAVQRFPLILTTNQDEILERAAAESQTGHEPRYRGDMVPAPGADEHVIFKLRGGFERPESLVITSLDRSEHALSEENRKQIRMLLRKQVILFVGYKPDEEEFELLWEDLSTSYGGELPRCHLAVSQGRINDYLWQKWVWRGLLMFTADPAECMREVEQRTE
jgi:hypothetical protein